MSNTTPPRLLGLREILGTDTRPGLLPLGKSAFYALIRDGRLPRPRKIGRRSVWLENDILAALEKLTAEG